VDQEINDKIKGRRMGDRLVEKRGMKEYITEENGRRS